MVCLTRKHLSHCVLSSGTKSFVIPRLRFQVVKAPPIFLVFRLLVVRPCFLCFSNQMCGIHFQTFRVVDVGQRKFLEIFHIHFFPHFLRNFLDLRCSSKNLRWLPSEVQHQGSTQKVHVRTGFSIPKNGIGIPVETMNIYNKTSS